MLGIIGGSGLYDIDGLTQIEWVDVKSLFGKPSDKILKGKLNGVEVCFLPRHGKNHHLSPTKINYRANIDALKRLGVSSIVSISAVGSLNENLHPGSIVIVDQFIDRTFAREKSFFGDGIVAHVSMADPVCERLCNHLEKVSRKISKNVFRGGTYLVMEGPQFSSRAESQLYRSWGCDVIGMTNMPEAKLAREAEICYATLAMVTDYDCWHPDHNDVDVKEVINNLNQNINIAQDILRDFVVEYKRHLISKCDQGCGTALENVIMTNTSNVEENIFEPLEAILGKKIK